MAATGSRWVSGEGGCGDYSQGRNCTAATTVKLLTGRTRARITVKREQSRNSGARVLCTHASLCVSV